MHFLQKTMKNVRKHEEQNLKKQKKKKKNDSFSIRTKLSYYKFFTKTLLVRDVKKTQILINKPVYLGLPIL